MMRPPFSKSMIAALTLFAIPSIASAHAHLESANPAAGSTVNSAPSQVMLHFNEGLEPKFSGAEVHDAAGARVDTGSSVSGSTIEVSVKALVPGAYSVDWHALSLDTHKTHGNFSFRVGK